MIGIHSETKVGGETGVESGVGDGRIWPPEIGSTTIIYVFRSQFHSQPANGGTAESVLVMATIICGCPPRNYPPLVHCLHLLVTVVATVLCSVAFSMLTRYAHGFNKPRARQLEFSCRK